MLAICGFASTEAVTAASAAPTLQFLPATRQAWHHFLCRYVPVPRVADEDRLLFMALPVRGLYRCVARYGYTEQVGACCKITQA